MVFVTSPTWKIRQSRAVNSPSPASVSQHKAWDRNRAVLDLLHEPRLKTYVWCKRTCLLPFGLAGCRATRPYLVRLDKMEVLPVDPEAVLKISTLFFTPGTKLICSRRKEELETCRMP